MTTSGYIVALMIAAGLLEIAGIATVVLDMRRGRQWARDWLARGNPEHPGETTWDMFEGLGPVLAESLQGGGRVRIFGVGLLLSGLVVGTIANVWTVLDAAPTGAFR